MSYGLAAWYAVKGFQGGRFCFSKTVRFRVAQPPFHPPLARLQVPASASGGDRGGFMQTEKNLPQPLLVKEGSRKHHYLLDKPLAVVAKQARERAEKHEEPDVSTGNPPSTAIAASSVYGIQPLPAKPAVIGLGRILLVTSWTVSRHRLNAPTAAQGGSILPKVYLRRDNPRGIIPDPVSNRPEAPSRTVANPGESRRVIALRNA